MNRKIKGVLTILVFVFMTISSCRKWEDHNAITDEGIGLSLLERIQNNPDLSKFTELLSKSGYADTLSSSRVYTVYAPTNAALSTIGPALENDLNALKFFVSNHIARKAYILSDISSLERIPVMSGKYHDQTAVSVDNVTFEAKNIVAKNGVVHVLSDVLPTLGNIWNFVANDARMPGFQKALLYDSLGSLFRTRVYNLSSESRNYTLFVLKDDSWRSELNKFLPYFTVPGNPDSAALVTGWMIARDLAIDTLYPNPDALPDTVTSKFGIKIGIDKSEIAETIKTSNGVVYVMNRLEVPLRNKFKDIIIEGENYAGASASRLANTYIRDKRDSATGRVFRDVLVYNHGLAQFNLRYRLSEVPSIKYRAYWMALNDNINGMTAPFSQKIGVDSFNSPNPSYAVVQLNRYAEQFAGEFTLTKYKPTFNLFLTAANNTTANTNALVCNYIRLEPVF